ncbi:MAG: 50S ribosomal protein L28 [Chloroflexaceae bacterium]|nr:50S ribosomal protein L28 [Chloroflexaceae bacterium]
MARCQMTGKGPSFGHNVSHSKRRTRRIWRPNIQKVTITDENGNRRQVKICTSHLRTLYKVR